MIRHRQEAEPAVGQFYVPIAGFVFLQAIVFALYFPLRALGPQSGTVSALGWIFVLSLPAAGLASGTGRLYRRIHSAGMLLARLGRACVARARVDGSRRVTHISSGNWRADSICRRRRWAWASATSAIVSPSWAATITLEAAPGQGTVLGGSIPLP